MHDQYDTMLFNYETSNRTDYRDGEIRPILKPINIERPKCLVIRPPPLKDIHTLSEWKKPNVPLNLYFRPKDIVRTNPYEVQQYFEKPPDLDREFAKRTRPRLVMTPAISMDDIHPLEKRQLLVSDVYSSTAHADMRKGIAGTDASSGAHAPLSETPASANPITLYKLQAPYVSPEWRMDSVSWDSRQLRAHCEPDKEFYLARKPRCNACDLSSLLKRQENMARKIKTQ